jgi:hypothetical protein
MGKATVLAKRHQNPELTVAHTTVMAMGYFHSCQVLLQQREPPELHLHERGLDIQRQSAKVSTHKPFLYVHLTSLDTLIHYSRSAQIGALVLHRLRRHCTKHNPRNRRIMQIKATDKIRTI